MDLGERAGALKTVLDAMPGAGADVGPGPARGVLLFKVMGKMFAILESRKIENVILKCDPHLAEVLRERYAGIGHRSHLDHRHWISINLAADVPADEVARLAAHSYDLVCAGLTRKQRAELDALKGA